MVKNGYRKVFADPQKLEQLITLRRVGWAETSLALFFGCGFPSVSTKLAKQRVPHPKKVFSIEIIASKVIPQAETRWRMSGGERICVGKSYDDYLMSK